MHSLTSWPLRKRRPSPILPHSTHSAQYELDHSASGPNSRVGILYQERSYLHSILENKMQRSRFLIFLNYCFYYNTTIIPLPRVSCTSVNVCTCTHTLHIHVLSTIMPVLCSQFSFNHLRKHFSS